MIKRREKKHLFLFFIDRTSDPRTRNLEKSDPESFPNRFIVGSAVDTGHTLGWPGRQNPPSSSFLPTGRVSPAPDVVRNSPTHWFVSTEEKKHTMTSLYWLLHPGEWVSGLFCALFKISWTGVELNDVWESFLARGSKQLAMYWILFVNSNYIKAICWIL